MGDTIFKFFGPNTIYEDARKQTTRPIQGPWTNHNLKTFIANREKGVEPAADAESKGKYDLSLLCCHEIVSCPDHRSSPSLKRSGDPSPKGRFNGRDMGGVMSGLSEVSKILQASKAV